MLRILAKNEEADRSSEILHMSDMDYINVKLRELAEQGTTDILKALMRKQSEATLAGALGDERSLLFL